MRMPLLLLLIGCGGGVSDSAREGCWNPQVWYPPEAPADDEAANYFGCDPPEDWTTDPNATTGTTTTPRAR